MVLLFFNILLPRYKCFNCPLFKLLLDSGVFFEPKFNIISLVNQSNNELITIE